jgi:hypothetical protein
VLCIFYVPVDLYVIIISLFCFFLRMYGLSPDSPCVKFITNNIGVSRGRCVGNVGLQACFVCGV